MSEVSTFGRIHYVEPTNIAFYSNGAKAIVPSNDLIFNPPEDYCIAVDLQVMIPDRKACSVPDENGGWINLQYSSTHGTLSFMHGTDGALTTNFTDINYVNPEKNTNECLGIESIQITYDSWFAPQVTIKFVDVRGGSVFSQEEKAYQNKGGVGSIYRALFNIPSPIFKLKVKGFYGHGVTYYLVEEDVNMDLDSSSGNFNITVKFIGQRYRIYADIPMVYLCAAPYMQAGGTYWSSMVSNGTFAFTNRNGTKSQMCTFPELRKKIAQAVANLQKSGVAARGEQMEVNNKAKREALNNIKIQYPLRGWYIDSGGCYFVTTADIDKKNIAEKIKNYLEMIEEYDKTNGTNYKSNFGALAVYAKNKTMVEDWVDATTIKEYLYNFEKDGNNEWNNLLNSNNGLREYVVGELSKFSNKKVAKLFEAKGNFYNERKFLEEVIDQAIKSCEEEYEKAKAEYEAMATAEMEKALGFTPSIKNVYDLVFAHMDTFMQAYFEHMGNIRKKLNEHDPERKKDSYDSHDTDISLGETELPPYPAFYKIKDTNGERRKELVWPEDMPGGNKLDEVIFVKDLLRASALFTDQSIKAAEDAKKILENLGSGNDNGDAPPVNVSTFVPVTVNDFALKNGAPNPYDWIRHIDSNKKFENDEGLEDAIIGTFVLRAIYYLSVNPNNKEGNTFGRIDASNLIKAFGKDYYSSNFYQFIKKYADDRNEKSEASDAITRLCGTVSNVWSGNLITNIGDRLEFHLIENGYYPVNRSNLAEMSLDKTHNNFKGNGYIPESRYQDMGPGNETFFIFRSRDYLNATYAEIDKLGEDEDFGIDLGSLKRYKDNFDSKYDRDDLSYPKGTVYATSDDKEKKLSNSKLRKVITEGGTSDIFVKYPTMINEEKHDSLFDEDYYNGQDLIESKAYLFLMAMPLMRKNDAFFGVGNIPKKCENGVDLLPGLLREGALYWREQCMNEGADPIKIDTTKYKRAASDEMYISIKDRVLLIFGGENNEETLTVLPQNERKSYPKFTPPEGCTDSRKRVLANYFKEWALNSYKPIEHILTDKSYYHDNDFTKGLDPSDPNNGMRGANITKLNQFLADTFFGVSTTFDYYAGRPTGETVFSASKAEVAKALDGFMTVLERAYKDKTKQDEQDVQLESIMKAEEDPFNNKDLRLSTYMTLKSLYDKWLVAPLNGRETWKLDSPKSDFSNFQYIDTYYHDIGLKLNTNITKVGEWLSNCMPSQNIETSEGIMGYYGRSMYEFLTEVAQHVGGTLFAFPQRIGGRSINNLGDMFKAMNFLSDWDTDESTFVFMYSYQPSEHLGNGEFEDDGFDIPTEQVKTFMSDNGYAVPAFGVSYAKQNQSFFKSLTLNTSSPAVTEASITATMAIAAKGSEGVRDTSLFGQDLYRVKTNYAYQCEIDMMGCVQVVPLMYFQLNNVPFWRGAYVILKVSHDIRAGDMTTHIVGQRVNKYSIPLTTTDMIGLASVAEGTDTGGGSTSGAYGSGYEPSAHNANVPDYANNDNVSEHPNKSLDQPADFDESNVTEEKPIICLTPAHGPRTSKGSEWFWSRKLIDQYIIPKLKTIKFFDGTSYAKNIQRCNKDNYMGNYDYSLASKTDVTAKNTGSAYSTKETQAIIEKYGSKKVISIVPHWNGGGGNYIAIFDGVNWGSGPEMRADSSIFSSFAREEAKKVVERGKNNEFAVMPKGMMKSVNSAYHLLDDHGDKTDGGGRLKCACVLSENFFADYGEHGAKDWTHELSNIAKYAGTGQGWDSKDGNRYLYGEGWLLSDEGMTAISDMHVEAIRRYINSLHNGEKNFGGNSMSKSNGKGLNGISEETFEQCAQRLGCEVAALKAVVKVESGRNGFLQEGKPSILFEGHKFWANLITEGKNPQDYVSGNEDILYPTWTKKYYKGGYGEYERLERAKKINETAALKSASWGAMQVLGENYAACGCSSVQEFVRRMSESNDEQMVLGTNFILHSSKMSQALREKDWATFARYYNGKGYKENHYDERLAVAYSSFID